MMKVYQVGVRLEDEYCILNFADKASKKCFIRHLHDPKAICERIAYV